MYVQQTITDDLDALLDVLPAQVASALRTIGKRSQLLEIVLDLGRKPEARFTMGEAVLDERDVTEDDLLYVAGRIGTFGEDNRAGIERTLHRISCIRNRNGRIVGLTCRVGRAVFGTIAIIQDVVESGQSILLMGRPGVGKTTMLREVARVLSDDMRKRVVVVDTSNEIAGDGDIPHPAIGRARRMQVPSPVQQHAVMIEAVENHMPEVVIIDEISTDLEAVAARTIAERGVQLVGTAHGNTLENLIMNPSLADLIGGIQSVTLGDDEARRRGTQKSILERKAPPTFDVVVEIQGFNRVAIHKDVARTVDTILRGRPVQAEVRELNPDGGFEVREEATILPPEPLRPNFGGRAAAVSMATTAAPPNGMPGAEERVAKVFVFGVSRARVEQAIRAAQLPLMVTDRLQGADALLTVRNYFRRRPQTIRDAEANGIPVYVLKSHTTGQLHQGLQTIAQGMLHSSEVVEALKEAEDAINRVLSNGDPLIELNPQNAYIRRLQHQVAQRYNLQSQSAGREPLRRVRIYHGAAPEPEE